jgi:exodeoxyribonuclease X
VSLLRVIDFETTGLERSAEVVEVGWCDFDTEAKEDCGSGSFLCGVSAMPPDTRAVHHIRLEDVAGLPPFNRALFVERAMLDGVSAFVAHMADFEAQFLTGSVPLVCSYKAALRKWPAAPSHSVFGLLYWLEDQGLVEFDRGAAHPPHRAGPDTYATAVLLGALYRQGVTSLDLWRWTQQPRLLPRCTIGKFRGRPWAEVEGGFLQWMLKQDDMEEDLRWNAQEELNQRSGSPPAGALV